MGNDKPWWQDSDKMGHLVVAVMVACVCLLLLAGVVRLCMMIVGA